MSHEIDLRITIDVHRMTVLDDATAMLTYATSMPKRTEVSERIHLAIGNTENAGIPANLQLMAVEELIAKLKVLSVKLQKEA